MDITLLILQLFLFMKLGCKQASDGLIIHISISLDLDLRLLEMENGQSGLNGAVTLNVRAAEQEIVQIPCLSLVVPTVLMRATKSLILFVMGMIVVLVEEKLFLFKMTQ